MSAWAALDRELEAWAAAGLRATLWWRDDDATADTPALRRLLDAAGGRPLALAVIPAGAKDSLAAAIAGRPEVSVLQHGFAHRNHAPPPAKKSELGPDRPVAAILDELALGRERLRRLFGARALAVLVPPWNRIADPVVGHLPGLGFLGISCYGPRAGPSTTLITVNTHVDIVDWHGSRGFIGAEAALALLVGHLAARREGRADPAEPTGLITHHLVHDPAAWAFAEALTRRLDGRAQVLWVGAPEAFAPAGTAP